MSKNSKDLNDSDISSNMNSDTTDEHDVVSKNYAMMKDNNENFIVNNENFIVNNKESLAEGAIDFANSILNFAKKEFCYIYIKERDELYFKGKEIASFFEYKDTDKAIRKIDADEKKKYCEIFGNDKNKFNGPAKSAGPLQIQKLLEENENNTMYITEFGLYELAIKSSKTEAIKFKKFITKELLPTLRKTGTYTLPTAKNITNAIRERDEKIKQLEYNNANTLAIEKEKTMQEKEKTKQEKEKEKTKQLELQYKLKLLEKEIQTELKPEPKQEPKPEPKPEPKINNYLKFLEEKTQVSSRHIHCTTLFEEYKKWHKDNKKVDLVPSNKEFISCMQKYKKIEKVRVGDKILLGVKNLKLKD